MGVFITLEVNGGKCAGVKDCGACLKVCPVNVFAENDNRVLTDPEAEDECTLCDLCIRECNYDALKIVKHY